VLESGDPRSLLEIIIDNIIPYFDYLSIAVAAIVVWYRFFRKKR